MRHLVLGARGQIGAHLVDRLLVQGHLARAIDLEIGDAHDLRRRDNELLIAGMEWCDVVHFLAFDVGGSSYLEKYQHTFSFISNNIKIMDSVFDVLKRVRKPFFFASTQMSNMAHSTYGMLKAIGEAYSRAVGGVVVQFWNVYGWESDHRKSHVITDFIRKAHDLGRIEMRTSGKEKRQFLYADDCADCLIRLAQRYDDICGDKPLHITSFEWTSINRVAELVSRIFGDCPVVAGTREDDVQRDIQNEPDRHVLEFWQPVTQLADGIREVARKMDLGASSSMAADDIEREV